MNLSALLRDRNGAMKLGDAPTVVVIVGFVFLMMATVAFVGEEYQTSFSADESSTVANETLTSFNETVQYVSENDRCNFEGFTIDYVINESNDVVLSSTNYSTTSDGGIYYTGLGTTGLNNTIAEVTYNYDYSGIACNITTNLNKELDENTSIAGIVLTISLVGIVLSILIGIFISSRRNLI